MTMSMTETVSRPRRTTQGRYRPPTWRSLVVNVSFAATLAVYLFVNAPPPLAAEAATPGTVPIRTVFAMLERENDAARALWTQEIVERGKAVGLAFDEQWREAAVLAGPLPALFLRETARNLERTSLRLSLFLGSQFPINAANQLSGEQSKRFDALVQSGAPQHFIDPATGLQTAMFADVAVTDACVSCHNEHEDSPKTDWRPNEVMGATTWMYPEASVTVERAVELVAALRTSIRRAYAAYLEKVATFPSPPSIGAAWPRDGFALPTEDLFMRELARRSSTSTLLALLDPHAAETELAEAAPVAPTATAARPPTQPAPMDPVEAPDGTLVIRSARSTRVTVEHAGSRLLIARLLPGGVATLSSRPPLRVLLSDSKGVEVEFAGRKIALPPRDPAAERGKDVEVIIGGSPTPEKS